MTKTTTLLRSSALVSIKGRGKAMREAAFGRIAALSYVENVSRATSIDNARTALGANPTEAEVSAAKEQWTVGRIAARLPVTEFPKGQDMSQDGVMDFAFLLLTKYATCPKEGAKPGKLKAGKLGWRSPAQQKTVNAAWEACSVFFAELGLSNAKTQDQKNAAKKTARAPHHNTSQNAGKIDPANPPKNAKAMDVKPTLGAAGPVKHTSREEVCEYVGQMAATLLAYSNKHAKLLPTDFGMAIVAFKTAINAAMNAEEDRKAKMQASAKG